MSQTELIAIVVAASLKSAVILALAGLVNVSWRRSSASARHLVWTVGVASALALPALGVIEGRLNSPTILIPVWTPPSPAMVSAGRDAPSTRLNEREPENGLVETAGDPAQSIAFNYATPGNGVTKLSTSIDHASSKHEVARIPGAKPIVVDQAQPAFQRLRNIGGVGLLYIYLAGAATSLIPLLLGIARLRILARRASPAATTRWASLISRTPAISHFAGRIRIIESSARTMPMTWGIIEPTLLVPADSDGWPDWKCRNILLHELAHIERRDCLTQLLAQLACAAYWFNPLVWVAAHRMRVERELACDDKVITAGSAASDYASNLLDVARSLRSPSLTSSTAIAMARPSHLSGRLLAVLDATRNRSSLTRGIRATVSGAALAVVIPMSFIIPGSSAVNVAPTGVSARLTSHHTPTPGTKPAQPVATAESAPMTMLAMSNSLSSLKDGFLPLVSAASSPLPSLQSADCNIGDGKSGTHISSSSNDNDGSRPSYNVRYTNDNCSLEVTAEGKFTLRPDLSDIETIASDGWFRVEERIGRQSHRVEIRRADNGGLDHQYWVNGDRTPFNDEARAWLARTLLAVERHTAIAASTRVPQLYRSGGVRGVMSEIALMDGAYPKSTYYKTFLGMGVSLDANTLNTIVKQSAADLSSSDYYLSEVLSQFALQPSVNEITWRTFAETAGTMKSDYYRSEVLKKVLKSGRLSPATVGILLNSASGMKSDYYLSDLLQGVANQYAVNGETRQYYVNALRNIESDYYRGEVIKTLNKDGGAWDARTSSFVLTSVADIKSDYYRSEALSALVKARHVSDWNSYFNAVSTIPSDYYKKEALNAVLDQKPLSRDAVVGILGVVSKMKSDSEASEVLSNVANSYRIDDSLRPAFEKAVDSIDSEYYRGSALSALRRSMAR